MANPTLLAPVAGDDPCGPDLRWDPEFLGLGHVLDTAVSQAGESVLDAEVAQSGAKSFEEVVDMAVGLSARTKDLRVLVVYAEASWRLGGLAAFAAAMEDLVAVLETWPGPEDGIHPRADEDDGDLGERAAAMGRMLKRIPALAATFGWGENAGNQAKVEGSATLKGVFGAWSGRLEAAFGPDLPSSSDAWRSLRELVVASNVSDPAAGGADDEGDAPPPPPAQDVWDLIDQATERMGGQDRHSPALPVLQLLAGWRSLDIVEIVDRMKASGLSLEQLLESIKKQTRESA